MHLTDNTELTDAQTRDLVRRGVAKGRRMNATRRAVSGVAALAVVGALGLVLFRKAVYSALSMAFTMLNLAVLYGTMDAPFLVFVQIIVYTGAILMLFLFVGQQILGFLNLRQEEP